MSTHTFPPTQVFTFEAVVKMVALGLWGPHTYFADGWNVFDFCNVLLFYFAMLPGASNLTALRTLRALRPLRTLELVPPVRRAFNALMSVVPRLASVLLVTSFVTFVCGLVGTQMWAGAMSGGCAYRDPSQLSSVTQVTLNDSSNTAAISTGQQYLAVPGWVRTRCESPRACLRGQASVVGSGTRICGSTARSGGSGAP